MTFNVGLIGAGRIGKVHAKAIAAIPGAQITMVADFFVEAAEKCAAEFGIETAVKDWQPLMENLSDATLIGTEDRGGNSRYHITATAPAEQVEIITARLVRNQELVIDFWIQPVTGEVREAQFAAEFDGAEVRWTLLLDDYGAEFDIQPPEEIAS